MSLLDSCVSRLVSPCPFLFCSMSQLFTLCPYLYVCSLPPTHMPIHQILRLTVISTIKLCFPDSKLYLCMCRVSYNDNLMSYQIIRLTVLSTIKLCFPDSKLYLCMCRVSYNDNLMSYQIIRLTVLSTIKLCFPDSKLYLCMCRVSCNDNLMSYQIIRLTVLSTIKLCFPDSKLYLCMCRVIYFCQLLMWKAGHIRFYIWLSYQRIVWFYCGFYVRLSYQRIVWFYCGFYVRLSYLLSIKLCSLWSYNTTNRVILRLSTVDSTSDYFPDSKLNLCMCCVIGCQLLMRKLPTHQILRLTVQVMLPGFYCICVVIMIKCGRFYSYLLCSKLPGLEVVSSCCWLWWSNVKAAHTPVSTIKLCFPDSKLYLRMCRVIG